MTGSANGAAAVAILAMPSSGRNTSGRSAVTKRGTASVVHQIAIHKASAAVAHPAADSPGGAGLR